MFWVDVILSLILPVLAFGIAGLITRLIMAFATVRPEALSQAQRQEASRVHVPEHETRIDGQRGWESSFDAEVQRIRRRSLGH
jgi:hypothetical protein